MELTENFGKSVSDEEDGSGTEEDSLSEFEEDEEPKLKYKRLSSDLVDILSKDAASCIAVHPKFIALGTHWGMIYILDYCGNKIQHKELAAHSTTVNQITIDDNGDHIASCSDDGKVVIHGLCTTDNNHTMNFDRPVRAVALDPGFNKSGNSFVIGEEQLVLHEKGFLGRKSCVLHKGEGPVRNIKWRSNFIAWANDKGVKVFDMTSRKRITFIAKENPQLRPEMYRCCLSWNDSRTLLIGWCDKVKICVVKDRDVKDARDLPNTFVEITHYFTVDFYICGIAPFGNQIVLLTYDESQVYPSGSRLVSPRPHLRILEPGKNMYEEIDNDALSIRGFEEYRCNDYHLECLSGENMFVIVSPKDVVVALPRDQDDHITWLVENCKFEEAMKSAFEYSKDLKVHNAQTIGRQYLDYLLHEKDYENAGKLCMKILGRSKSAWEDEVYKFAELKQLKTIATYVPLNDPQLSPLVYEMILNEFLLTDAKGFETLVNEWPCDLYNIQTLINAVLDKLDMDPTNCVLMRSLAQLYTHDKKHDKALEIYLRLKDKRAFDLIHKHNLFHSISDKIVLLMNYNKQAAVKMFLDNLHKIPVKKVAEELKGYPELLHTYLHELFIRDASAGQDYHALQVELYAEYDRSQLMYFLQQSNHYPLQSALHHLTTRDLYPEMVFLLGRMGNTKEALKMITNQLRDVNKAIEFCKEQNDKELWEDLINYSIDKPSFIRGLLQNIGTHVDPIILIKRIRPGMEIIGLRDSLVKILHDYNLQISLREGCKKILVADCYCLFDKLVRTQRRAIRIEDNQICHICNERILVSDLRFSANLMVFNCKHCFHEDCLPAHRMNTCPICNAQVRSPGLQSKT